MQKDEAQIIALKGLEYLAEDPGKFSGFLGLTGMSADDVIKVAGETSTLIGILDYLLSDETILFDFCNTADVDPELPKNARIILSGEDYY